MSPIMFGMFGDPAAIDPSLDCRAATFENVTGARGGGGTEADGRKGAAYRTIKAGERVTLCELDGPGRVTHMWCTVPPAPPEELRALTIEGWYDGGATTGGEPSISVPLVDLFGVAHGRPVAYASVLAAMQEGRGFNLHVPMPFVGGLRLEFFNGTKRNVDLYYQLDVTLGAVEPSYLHVSWRRENPTTMQRDFVIADGIEGPGRFLGCNVGVRVLDGGNWYGEGEVKVFRDGDTTHPTICGTGLEDYVGSAWGMGAHHSLWAGAPLDVREHQRNPQPDFVGFYRWHVPDPIMFASHMRVTIQQIGMAMFGPGHEAEFEAYAAAHPVAGRGWWRIGPLVAAGIADRVDDYCATAFVYATRPQPVERVDVAAAIADVARRPYERPSTMEQMLSTAVNAEIDVFRPR
jgi:hypothetical protein